MKRRVSSTDQLKMAEDALTSLALANPVSSFAAVAAAHAASLTLFQLGALLFRRRDGDLYFLHRAVGELLCLILAALGALTVGAMAVQATGMHPLLACLPAFAWFAVTGAGVVVAHDRLMSKRDS